VVAAPVEKGVFGRELIRNGLEGRREGGSVKRDELGPEQSISASRGGTRNDTGSQ